MNSVLVHRGPDDEGFYDSPAGPTSCHMAMRRLSIIDLEGGHQPIANSDESCWIVYNGETYNHCSLRSRLERSGHRFFTNSDTEVVLHAYEEYGLSFVDHLRGMFALAIWDSAQQRLILARDPVGIKPLFYAQQSDRLYFASEIKALLQAGLPRALDPVSLYHYLTYLYVPAPQTMFAGIQQLPPGHTLVWERGQVSIEEFWGGPSRALNKNQTNSRINGLWPALLESTQAHLVSDVPVGVFLSGGLDSSALALAVKELGYRPLKTFCIGFRGAGLYDESPHARQVSRFLGTEHFEHHVESDIVEELPSILRFLDEPMADASVLPNFVVARLASQHVKVALSGAGGDELLGGYRRYAADRSARWASVLLPSWLREHIILPLLRLLPSAGDSSLGNMIRLAEKFFAGLGHPPERRYIYWNSCFREADKHKLLDRVPCEDASYRLCLPFFNRVRHRNFPDQAMYVDLKTYLPGDPLMLTDRLTMAHSLEARVPFLDRSFMEFAAALPTDSKIRGWETKVGFRQALAGRLPVDTVSRPKQGFGTPIDIWLRRELKGVVQKLLSPEAVAARGLFNPDQVQELRQRQLRGGRDLSQHVWCLAVLELWHRAYIDHDYSARSHLTFGDLL